jgi:hypothetical protein
MTKKGSNRKNNRKKTGIKKGSTKPASRRSVAGATTQAARISRQRVRHEDGTRAAGQSGNTQGLRRAPLAASESVEELVDEGQSFEAEAVSGVERASDIEGAEVSTGEVPEDDVPEEYRNVRNKED